MILRYLFLITISLYFSIGAKAKSTNFPKSNTDKIMKTCPLLNLETDEMLKRQELSKAWESLPGVVLVAKKAHLVVEGDGFRSESLQNFLKPGSAPQVCVTGDTKQSQRFSILAPTLIDLTSSANTGSSVWNFQLITEKKQVRAWNLLSRVSTTSFDLSKIFKDQGAVEKYYRLGAADYEIVVTKEIGGKSVTLTVTFDSVE